MKCYKIEDAIYPLPFFPKQMNNNYTDPKKISIIPCMSMYHFISAFNKNITFN